jgi:hypothetical protein
MMTSTIPERPAAAFSSLPSALRMASAPGKFDFAGITAAYTDSHSSEDGRGAPRRPTDRPGSLTTDSDYAF